MRNGITQLTNDYEKALRKAIGKQSADVLAALDADLDHKHSCMAEDAFQFLRATFYWWAGAFRKHCPHENEAHQLLGVGDVHIENYATWRDAEGRLVWGLNDFDEATTLPYTSDLVRLLASVLLALPELAAEPCAEAILDGYAAGIVRGGQPFILDGAHPALADHVDAARVPIGDYWGHKEAHVVKVVIDPDVERELIAELPGGRDQKPHTIGHRAKAGLGSLGRPRFIVMSQWRGGHVAREAKPVLASAWDDEHLRGERARVRDMLRHEGRDPDPFTKLILDRRWVLRRLAADTITLDLAAQSLAARSTDQNVVLGAMGRELANIHGRTDRDRDEVGRDLAKRRWEADWLAAAARRMAKQTKKAQEEWKAEHGDTKAETDGHGDHRTADLSDATGARGT
jgi:hypothetical protein